MSLINCWYVTNLIRKRSFHRHLSSHILVCFIRFLYLLSNVYYAKRNFDIVLKYEFYHIFLKIKALFFFNNLYVLHELAEYLSF